MGGRLSSQQIQRASLLYTAGLKWYSARTHDTPATISYFDHLAIVATHLYGNHSLSNAWERRHPLLRNSPLNAGEREQIEPY
ncbi:hypothetical protein TNCV_3695741 [Trichonephila clavipes]|nr:hypothetical protein TNCV_3695741 [Trichonephila clavipes]